MESLQEIVAKITQEVIENGRVEGSNLESLWVEVEFEAREQGYENSEEIADTAKERAESGKW